MSTKAFEYHFLAFSKTGLEHRSHRLTAKMDGPDCHAFINFDYAEYTYDDTLVRATGKTSSSAPPTTVAKTRTTPTTPTTPATTTTTTTPSTSASNAPVTNNDETKSSVVGPVAGGVFGGLFILGGFIFALVVILRKVRNGSGTMRPGVGGSPEIDPFTGHLDSNHPITLKQKQQQGQVHKPQDPPAPFYLNNDSNQHQNVRVPYSHDGSPSSSSPGGGTVQTSLPGKTKTTSSGSSGSPVYTREHHRNRPPVKRSRTLPSRTDVAWVEPVKNERLDGNGRPISAPAAPPRADTSSPAVLSQAAMIPTTNTPATAAAAALTPSSDRISQFVHLSNRNLNSRVQALQQSICQVISDIQAESEALSRSGVSEEQIDRSLAAMREDLGVMAEQMAVIQIAASASGADAAGRVEHRVQPAAVGSKELEERRERKSKVSD